jgi:dTDP-glucose pyrophosphorylase
MAGRGERFLKAGVKTPKPFIDIKGRWMLEWSLKGLPAVSPERMIFVVLREHEVAFGVSQKLKERFGSKIKIVIATEVTEGAACTVLLAKEFINNNEGLLIHDVDSYIVSDIEKVIREKATGISGIIFTANLSGTRWSFAKTNENGIVIQTSEKARISDHACTGLYYFTHGRDFVAAAERMVRENKRQYGEFYITPVYQELIEQDKKVIIHDVKEYWEFGTPDSLDNFLKNYKGSFL